MSGPPRSRGSFQCVGCCERAGERTIRLWGARLPYVGNLTVHLKQERRIFSHRLPLHSVLEHFSHSLCLQKLQTTRGCVTVDDSKASIARSEPPMHSCAQTPVATCMRMPMRDPFRVFCRVFARTKNAERLPQCTAHTRSEEVVRPATGKDEAHCKDSKDPNVLHEHLLTTAAVLANRIQWAVKHWLGRCWRSG